MSVVLGLVGSVIGCSVAYVLPAVLALKDMRLRKRAGLTNSGKDVLLCHGLIPMGVVFGGTCMCILYRCCVCTSYHRHVSVGSFMCSFLHAYAFFFF